MTKPTYAKGRGMSKPQPPFTKVTTPNGSAWVRTKLYESVMRGLESPDVRLVGDSPEPAMTPGEWWQSPYASPSAIPRYYTPAPTDLRITGTRNGRPCRYRLVAAADGEASLANFEWEQRRARQVKPNPVPASLRDLELREDSDD